MLDVTIARDGQEALDIVRDSMANGERFDLVFMDIQMPNLDGIQSTKLIREMGFSAPIVALTAFAEESNMKECMASGMDFFLPKPIRRPALKQVLKKYCTTIPEEEGDSAATAAPAKVPITAPTASGTNNPIDPTLANGSPTKVKLDEGSKFPTTRVKKVIDEDHDASYDDISPMS